MKFSTNNNLYLRNTYIKWMHTSIHKKPRISFCSLSKNKYTRESTAEELPFEGSNFRISSKESKAGLKKSLNSILQSGQTPLTCMPRAIASLLVLGDPLSLNSDQHQFSPNNINTSLTEKIMKINKMITKADLLSNSLN